MNFLAHSLMGFDDPELIAGQFCGDFVRGSNLSHFPVGVERGIRLHRHLDVFTDAHPALLPIRDSMPGVPRRFAGIVIDVLFDHHLARHWANFSERSLEAHANRVHHSLEIHSPILPDSLQKFMRVLHEHGILERNRDIAAIELTLQRLSRRSPRFAVLAIEQQNLVLLRDQLQDPFDTFYPALHQAALKYLSNNSMGKVARD